MASHANIKDECIPATSEFTMLNFPENDEGINIQDPDLIESLIPSAQSVDPKPSVTLTRQRIFKIIVIGDSGVGKTCLTLRFCVGKFPEKIEATIGVDFREKNLEVGGESLKIQIWDTAGQERFRQSMVPHYYRNVHAVIFVYDVTKRSSFENLIGWIEECNANHLGPEVPRILVGNKCDNTDALAVLTQEAQCFADRCCMPLFETSAKDDSASNHVDSIFLTVAYKLKNSRPMMYATVTPPGYESQKNQPPLTLPCTTNCVPAQKSSSKCFC